MVGHGRLQLAHGTRRIKTQRTPLGHWRVHSELVTGDLGAVRLSEALRRVMSEPYKGFTFAKITGDPMGDVRAQTEEVTPFQILRGVAKTL